MFEAMLRMFVRNSYSVHKLVTLTTLTVIESEFYFEIVAIISIYISEKFLVI